MVASGGASGGLCASASLDGFAGLISLGGSSFAGGASGWTAGGVVGNDCGGRVAEGASGISCFGCSCCCPSAPTEIRQKSNMIRQTAMRCLEIARDTRLAFLPSGKLIGYGMPRFSDLVHLSSKE